MNYSKSFLMHVLFSLLIVSAIIFLCYHLFDKPLAFWIYQHNIPNSTLKWLTEVPKAIYLLAPALLLLAIISTSLCGKNAFLRCAFNVGLATIITRYFIDLTKYIFGRYWPLSWINHNPSLIKHKAYGFHFFHYGIIYRAFPSGITATSFAFLAALSLHYPKLRIPCGIVASTVAIAVIGMNFQFLSDVIAGAFLGTLIAILVVKR